MTVAAAINIEPYDVTWRVDPKRIRQNGSREIDSGKFTLVQQKTVLVAAAVIIESYDVALRVDPNRLRKSGSRWDRWW